MKTRLQSSSSSTVKTVSGKFVPRDHLLRNLQIIFKSEGFKALFKEPGFITWSDGPGIPDSVPQNNNWAKLKGLPATLFGTIPSRAIYFYSYNKSKSFFNYKDSPLVHIVSVSLNYLPKKNRSLNQGSTDRRTNPKTIFQGIISWFITNNINNSNMGGTNETTAGSDTWLQFIQMCTWHLSTQWASRILERDDCITFRIIRNCHFLFNLWKFKIKIYNARIVF